MEMVREAVSRFRKGDFAFAKVTWLNPLAVDQDEKEVYILLKDIPGLRHAGLLIEVSSHVWAYVAGLATGIHVGIQPGLLVRRQCSSYIRQ